jgi:thiol-disulfide isomerase/thioredoxin
MKRSRTAGMATSPVGLTWRLPALLLSLSIALVLPNIAASAVEPDVALSDLVSALPDSVAFDSKVVYVDFWASWCAPCRISMPWLRELAAEYRDDGLVILGVTVDKDTKAARNFVAEIGFPDIIVFDSTGIFAKQFQLEAMPTAFIFGRDGQLRQEHRGFKKEDKAELKKLLQSLLEGSAKNEE